MPRLGFILVALMLSSQVSAAAIFKCVDEAGKVTFTKNANCPRNTGLADVISAHNAAPSGSSAPVQMATPIARKAAAPKRELVVIGEQPVAPPTPSAAPAPRGGVVRAAGPAQPCIKIVERVVRSRTVNKDGSTRGRATMVKVPVAC